MAQMESALALEGEDLLDFEQHLWEACTEAMGRVPRPGERCWAEAQDRWRRALLDEALEARELVKLRVLKNSPEELAGIAGKIAAATGAAVAQTIGHIALFYRPSEKNPEIKLP